jgi:intergrase/recombinase
VRLINDKEAFAKYYNPDEMTLSHYKFPCFIRRNKKAYISFVTPVMIEGVTNIDRPYHHYTYSSIRHVCNRRGIACDMRFCRKIHGSWLHKSGITPEEIDFLQARINPSVFSRHYLTPQKDLKDRVLQSLEQLKNEIEKA